MKEKINDLIKKFKKYMDYKSDADYISFKANYFKHITLSFPTIFCVVSLFWLFKDLAVIPHTWDSILVMAILRGLPIFLLPLVFIVARKDVSKIWIFSLVIVWLAIFGVLYARYKIPTSNGHTGDGWIAYYFAFYAISLFALSQKPIYFSYIFFTLILLLTNAATWKFGFIEYMVPLSRPLTTALMITFCFTLVSPATRIIFILFYESKKQLEDFSKKDMLCDCYNRQIMNTLLDKNKFTYDATLILIEIDGFRRINFEKGALVADELLRKSAGVFKAISRPEDIVIRYSGSKFILAFKGFIDASTVFQRIQEYRQKAELNVTYSASACKVHVGEDIGTITEPLDKAFRESQANGGDQITLLK